MQNIFVAPQQGDDIRGGLIVCHGGTGLGDHERAQCERFATLGYAHSRRIYSARNFAIARTRWR